MDLTLEQRIQLCTDLQKFYKDEDRLKDIFLYHEDKFENIYNEISGDNYSSRIKRLIDELYNRQLLEQFLEIVGSKYPDIKKYYIYIRVFKEINYLINILRKIGEKNNDFIINFLSECVEDFRFESIEDLEKYFIDMVVDDYAFGDLSIDDFEKLNSYPGLIDFVEKNISTILTCDYLKSFDKTKIKQWIVKNFEIDVELNDNSEIQDTIVLNSYLLIIISTVRGETTKNIGKRFDIKAELIENFDRDYINTKISDRVNLNSEDINDEGYLENEIPNIIYKYIYEVIENDRYLGEIIKKGQTCNLKIELFLPKEFFIKDFDFEIPDAWKKDEYAICEKYPVILRSLDRLQRMSWRNTWNLKWQNFEQVRENKFIIDFDRCFEDKKTKNCLNTLLSTPKKRKQLGYILSEKIIVKISCGLPSLQERISSLFNIIIEQGIPLCFWINNKEEIDTKDYQVIIQELDRLTTNDFLHNTNKLCQEILHLRQKALADDNPGGFLGFHLRVMYDDNKRIPFNFRQSESNQLTSNA